MIIKVSQKIRKIVIKLEHSRKFLGHRPFKSKLFPMISSRNKMSMLRPCLRSGAPSSTRGFLPSSMLIKVRMKQVTLTTKLLEQPNISTKSRPNSKRNNSISLKTTCSLRLRKNSWTISSKKEKRTSNEWQASWMGSMRLPRTSRLKFRIKE